MRLGRSSSIALIAVVACGVSACRDQYSQDPKFAGAVAAAAGGIAIAQGAMQHAADVSGGSSFPAAPEDELRPLREYALRALNRVRADHELPPFAPSGPLTEFAQSGSEWLEGDHRAHAHRDGDARGHDVAEAQGTPTGEPAAPPEVQIDHAIARMLNDEGDRAVLLSERGRFAGVGISGHGGAMFLTFDFTEAAF